MATGNVKCAGKSSKVLKMTPKNRLEFTYRYSALGWDAVSQDIATVPVGGGPERDT